METSSWGHTNSILGAVREIRCSAANVIVGWEEDVLVLLLLDGAGSPSIDAYVSTSSFLFAASLFRHLLGHPESTLMSGGRISGYEDLVQNIGPLNGSRKWL
ncbi:hypothetical protein LIER_21869 [Lithospermum erythrorhizon]|uniref:Uncharacterized protein n=1 Tax=Lithospermum erythrorhizon TaxID=34254 RepID=A0AAV3QRR1_LITER